jgi:acid stress-induced BolA-like protein IbaG/YrbA
MDVAGVQALLDAHLDNCEVTVQGEGGHYEMLVIGEVFSGLRPVARQQLVYAALREQIADGSIHAVNIRTFTPGEWQVHGGA